jgi:hypothetical protein
VLAQAVQWAHLHTVDDLDGASTVLSERGEDTGITIAGEGAPWVSEFAVVEFATALGLSDYAGRALVGHALELVHRLPRLWARVSAGDLPAWRARRIAETTMVLSPEAAAYVDAQVAPFAHKIGRAATERLVEEAIARFMPDYATERRERAADARRFDVDHQQVSFQGTSTVHGELDLADALDLDAAVAAAAEQLQALGSESLDVRRAKGIGEIARTQLTLDLTRVPEADEGTAPGRPGRRAGVLAGRWCSTCTCPTTPSAGPADGGGCNWGGWRTRARTCSPPRRSATGWPCPAPGSGCSRCSTSTNGWQ